MNIVLKPRISEKAYALSQTKNVYVFTVPANTNRNVIAEAVEKQFGVEVASVKTLVAKGKAVSSYRKRSRAITASRADIKKAYVTLKEGHRLPFFDVPEEAEPKAADPKKTKKTASKETK